MYVVLCAHLISGVPPEENDPFCQVRRIWASARAGNFQFSQSRRDDDPKLNTELQLHDMPALDADKMTRLGEALRENTHVHAINLTKNPQLTDDSVAWVEDVLSGHALWLIS